MTEEKAIAIEVLEEELRQERLTVESMLMHMEALLVFIPEFDEFNDDIDIQRIAWHEIRSDVYMKKDRPKYKKLWRKDK